MHEVETANRGLNALRQISAGQKSRVLEVNLKVGGINEPDLLKLWLKKQGKEFGSTKFKLTTVPITIKCKKCRYEGTAKSIDTHIHDAKLGAPCPKCRGHDLSITTGQELEIVDVKLEPGR